MEKIWEDLQKAAVAVIRPRRGIEDEVITLGDLTPEWWL